MEKAEAAVRPRSDGLQDAAKAILSVRKSEVEKAELRKRKEKEAPETDGSK